MSETNFEKFQTIIQAENMDGWMEERIPSFPKLCTKVPTVISGLTGKENL